MQRADDEEDRECLMAGGGGGGGATVVVVEYLVSSMSKELLCKFPDNSAFDFDYSQSSIWSPLVPRSFPSFVHNINAGGLPLPLMAMGLMGISSSSSSSSLSSSELQRKLSFEEDECLLNNSMSSTIRKLTANIKKKITTRVFNNLQIYHKKKKKALNFSPNPPPAKCTSTSTTPTPRKEWAKMMKPVCKHFKKTAKRKDFQVSKYANF